MPRLLPAIFLVITWLFTLPTALAGQDQYDAELIVELEADFYWVLDAEGRILDPENDDGIAAIPRSGRDTPMPVDEHLRDPRGNPVGQTTVMALILVCKTYTRMAGAMADSFDETRTGALDEKRERLAAIEVLAQRLYDLDKTARELEHEYDRAVKGARNIRGPMSQEAIDAMTNNINTLRESSRAARQEFEDARNQATAEYPELAVEVDGVPLWGALAELNTDAVKSGEPEPEGWGAWLYDKFTDALAAGFDQGEEVPEATRIQIYNAYLEAGAEGLRETQSDCHKTVAELWEYGSGGYQTTRDAIRQHGEEVGATIPGKMMDALEDEYKAYETHQKVDDGWKDIIMATAGALLIPLGPAICAGYGVIEIIKEGSEVVVTYHKREDAITRQPIEGRGYRVELDEELRNESIDLAFTAVTVAPDFLEGVKTVRIVRPADEACTATARAADDVTDAAPSTGGAGSATDEAAEAAEEVVEAPPAAPRDPDRTPETGDVGGRTEQLDEPDLPPPADVPPPREPVGARPMEEVADDPNYLDTGGPDWIREAAADDLDEALEAARAEGVPDDQLADATRDVNPNSAESLDDARERVETLMRDRVGCIEAPNAPLRELAEVFTRTAGNGGRMHPEHFAWLQQQLAQYPNFFDMLPYVTYKGEILMDPDSARRLEEWFEAGRIKMPQAGDMPAFGRTDPCNPSDLPPIHEWERFLEMEKYRKSLETGGEATEAAGDAARPNVAEAEPVPEPDMDLEGATVTGDEATEAAQAAQNSPGNVTEQLDPPDLPPAADDAADAGRVTGDETVIEEMDLPPPADEAGNVTEQLDPPDLPPAANEAADAGRVTGDADEGASGGRTAGAAAQAAYDTEKTEQIEEGARLPEAEEGAQRDGAPETGDPDEAARAVGGGASQVAAITSLYEVTEVIPPIDIELTQRAGREDDPGTQTGGDEPADDNALESPNGADDDAGSGDTPTGDRDVVGASDAVANPLHRKPSTVPAVNTPTIKVIKVQAGTDDLEIGSVLLEQLGSIDEDDLDALLNSSWLSDMEVDDGAQDMTTGSFRFELSPSLSLEPDFKAAPSLETPRGPHPPLDPMVVSRLEVNEGPELEMIITSLGTSTGDAFQAIVLNRTSVPIRLTGEGLVLEPLKLTEQAQQEVEGYLRELAAQNVMTMTLTGYCLEFLKAPPTAGQLFRIAGSELQALYAPVRSILGAADKIKAAGLLNPDSDPREYFDSITQWAIWSAEQNLDLGGFERNFLEHTKKNVLASGQGWTPEFEDLVKSVVPNRWNDIQQVLAEAERIEAAVLRN